MLHSLYVFMQIWEVDFWTTESLAKKCDKTGWLYNMFVFSAELMKLWL